MHAATPQGKARIRTCTKYSWDSLIVGTHIFATLIPFTLLNFGGAIKTVSHFFNDVPSEFDTSETTIALSLGSVFGFVTLLALVLLNLRILATDDLYNNFHELSKHFKYINDKPLWSRILWWSIGLTTVAVCFLNALIVPAPMGLATHASYDLMQELIDEPSNTNNSSYALIKTLFRDTPVWANFAIYTIAGGAGISIAVLHLLRHLFMDSQDLHAQLSLVRARQHLQYLQMLIRVSTFEQLIIIGQNYAEIFSADFLTSLATEPLDLGDAIVREQNFSPNATATEILMSTRHHRAQTAPAHLGIFPIQPKQEAPPANSPNDDSSIIVDASSTPSSSEADYFLNATLGNIGEQYRILNPANPLSACPTDRLLKKILFTFHQHLKPRPHIKLLAGTMAALAAGFAYRNIFYAVQTATFNTDSSNLHYLLYQLGCQNLFVSALWNFANFIAMLYGTMMGLHRLFELYYLAKEEKHETPHFKRKTACLISTHILSSAMIIPAFMQAGGQYGADPTMYLPFAVGYGNNIPGAHEISLRLLNRKTKVEERQVRNALIQAFEALDLRLKRIEYDPKKITAAIYYALKEVRDSDVFVNAMQLLDSLGEKRLSQSSSDNKIAAQVDTVFSPGKMQALISPEHRRGRSLSNA